MSTSTATSNQISLEETLEEAPTLIEQLKKQYGNKVTIGKVWQDNSLFAQEPGGTINASILVNGEKVGVYEKDWCIDGTYAQRYNGKPIEQ